MAKNRGLYNKFTVTRNEEGSAAQDGHVRYFVIDLDTDKHAEAAIKAYAESCKRDIPALSSDLRDRADLMFQHRFFSTHGGCK